MGVAFFSLHTTNFKYCTWLTHNCSYVELERTQHLSRAKNMPLLDLFFGFFCEEGFQGQFSTFLRVVFKEFYGDFGGFLRSELCGGKSFGGVLRMVCSRFFEV